MRSSMWIACRAVAVAALLAVGGAGSASANHSVLGEWISRAPAAGNSDDDATFKGTSADGARVFFETTEPLVAADSDDCHPEPEFVTGCLDVYQRSGGTTTLVSTGGNGPFHAYFAGASEDGTRVFFETGEQLAAADTDTCGGSINPYPGIPDACTDVYERFGPATTLVSTGPGPATCPFLLCPADFAGASADGTRVFINTFERLVAADTDGRSDVYEASVFVPYPRPGGGTPLRVPLVPEFALCRAPGNSTHVAPLDLDSCSPPALQSSMLTTSTIGRMSASALFRVIPGNTGTPDDEADVQISASATDVLFAEGGGDYVGPLIFTTALRATDRANGTSEAVGATVQDTEFSFMMSCVATPTAGGGTCNLTTTADTIAPGFAREGKRAVLSLLSVTVEDAGPDGNFGPPDCQLVCGTGDEQVYLRQGLFAP